jgi:hypothetical protein
VYPLANPELAAKGVARSIRGVHGGDIRQQLETEVHDDATRAQLSSQRGAHMGLARARDAV